MVAVEPAWLSSQNSVDHNKAWPFFEPVFAAVNSNQWYRISFFKRQKTGNPACSAALSVGFWGIGSQQWYLSCWCKEPFPVNTFLPETDRRKKKKLSSCNQPTSQKLLTFDSRPLFSVSAAKRNGHGLHCQSDFVCDLEIQSTVWYVCGNGVEHAIPTRSFAGVCHHICSWKLLRLVISINDIPCEKFHIP